MNIKTIKPIKPVKPVKPVTHFHGMTRHAFEEFKQGKGKAESGVSPWVCSDNDGLMYFYSVEKLKQEYCMEYEKEDLDHIEQLGINRAFESASIQAAINAQSEIVVLCLNLDSVDVDNDYSCQNMDHIADCTKTHNVSLSHVVKAYSIPFNQYLSAFVLSGVMNKGLFNLGGIDSGLCEAAEQICNAGIILDSIYEIESQSLIDLAE